MEVGLAPEGKGKEEEEEGGTEGEGL